jgi:hypothetical protein
MSVRLNHIRSLKIRCNKLIGRSISNHSDVLLLKSILDENLDENISLSSLRRFFGLISPTKPNKKTLDILSKGIGFLNFYEFCNREEKNIEWNSVRSIILIQQKEILTQEDINSLTNLKNENILLFSYFIFEIIIKEKSIKVDRNSPKIIIFFLSQDLNLNIFFIYIFRPLFKI